jgi:hypothetical protein
MHGIYDLSRTDVRLHSRGGKIRRQGKVPDMFETASFQEGKIVVFDLIRSFTGAVRAIDTASSLRLYDLMRQEERPSRSWFSVRGSGSALADNKHRSVCFFDGEVGKKPLVVRA